MNNLNNLIGFIDDVNNVGRRSPQQYKDGLNYYNILRDDEFINRFRLSKYCVDYLLILLILLILINFSMEKRKKGKSKFQNKIILASCTSTEQKTKK